MFQHPGTPRERRDRPQPMDRRARAAHAVALFNTGRYWEAHEALETIWRSVRDGDEARALQGLIQAAAALLHRERGNRHGVRVVGGRALQKLAGPQHPAIEFETVEFQRVLRLAFERGGAPPTLRLREG
jgi:hypothetical protein